MDFFTDYSHNERATGGITWESAKYVKTQWYDVETNQKESDAQRGTARTTGTGLPALIK